MKIFEQATPLQEELKTVRLATKKIGLVPTMGNLHAGHLALVAAARKNCDYIVATIFVNPLQFGPDEDLGRYPRTLDVDKNKLITAGCNALFVPSASEMFPDGLKNQTTVSVPEISKLHCGNSRPGHFDGVGTIVCKLLNLVNPDTAFFGLKDYQQLLIIKKVVNDLCMPSNITGVPTVREESGLAMSSRNHYLNPEEKINAAKLYACLKTAKAEIDRGDCDFEKLALSARKTLSDTGIKVDYFNICNSMTLNPATSTDRELVILAAVFFGNIRLIDNITVSIHED